jgi:micrococcal nuclease
MQTRLSFLSIGEKRSASIHSGLHGKCCGNRFMISPDTGEIAMKIVGLLFLLASFPAFAQSEISGTAHVVDGNTIHVATDSGTVTVRLQGIAAPEDNQPGGQEATAFLEQYAEGEPVRCTLDGTKFRKDVVGICYVAGRDIAAAVIRAGLARDCPAFSGGRYWPIERPAAQKLVLPDYCNDGAESMGKQTRLFSQPGPTRHR